jgi:heat shock protein HslJ
MKPRRLSLPAVLAIGLIPATSGTLAMPAIPQVAATPGPSSAAPADEAAMLGQYRWQLSTATDASGKRIDVLFARPERPLQLDFADGRLRIGNVCNVLGAGYSIVDGRLQLTPMMHTMMMCANPSLMAMESAINDRLHDRPRLGLLMAGSTPHLRLVTDSGDTLVFVGRPKAETRGGAPDNAGH